MQKWVNKWIVVVLNEKQQTEEEISIWNTWKVFLSMLYLTLQTLLIPFIYTNKTENWTNKIVQDQKYEGLCPMVTHEVFIIYFLAYIQPTSRKNRNISRTLHVVPIRLLG